ncbi:hypothetical protein KW792_01160 [Candidatus Saccharibacteria bacterium]|nr:hypothetical protein [Candidatus Saccharibacteria bacterium]
MDQQPADTTSMPEYPRGGSGKKTLIIIILALLLVGSLAFGFWAYSQAQDYKKNTAQKTAVAVAQAQAAQKTQLQAEFDEQSKSPNKTFHGSPTYGSVTFSYPKNWSAYVDTTSTSEPINGYFHPDTVPSTQSKTAYALRVELVNTDYAQLLTQYTSAIGTGAVPSKAYVPPKMKGASNVTPGVYMTGKVNLQDTTQSGNLVAIKVRDKTLMIYSESKDNQKDFNDTILGSLTFAP